jgi:hypothetical protein
MPEERQRKQRAVGPRFPFVNLQKAIERSDEFRKAAGDYAIPVSDARKAWGYGEKSSGGDQTAAALRYYGLLEREGTGRLRLTDAAKRYLRDERPEVREELRRKFAFQPKVMRELWTTWKSDPPPDTAARSILKVDLNFPDKAADDVLRIYRENLAFAGASSSATLPPESAASDGQNDTVEEDESPWAVRVGDYVQWTSNGVDQFSIPRRVEWVSDDQTHIRVFGSMTGIPMKDVSLADAPGVPPAAQSGGKSEQQGASGKDINVLLTGKRLQITADVDKDGLVTLKQMLDKYAEILNLLN